MKRCLVVSDSFKGTLSSPEICRIARSIRVEGWQVDALPVADGGEGTVDCFLDCSGGRRVTVTGPGPFGHPMESFYGLLPDNTAVIECAAAAGLPLVERHPDPERTSTYGVGVLMAHALEHGAKRLILGLGGSCTNDGGCGAAAALGVRFYDRQGCSFVPVGRTLTDIADIDVSGLHPRLTAGTLTVMCDIDNPLYGPRGAAHVFAPQKGADCAMVERLDAGLRRFAAVLRTSLGISVDTLPGGGAAGGFGAGAAALLGGTLRSGIEAVLDTVDFPRRAAGCALVVTGEGRLDSQSLGGKVVWGVSQRCGALRIPAAVLAGALELEKDALDTLGLVCARSINPPDMPYAEARHHAAEYYRAALEALLKEVSHGTDH